MVTGCEWQVREWVGALVKVGMVDGGVCGICEAGFRIGYMRLAVRAYRKVGRE